MSDLYRPFHAPADDGEAIVEPSTGDAKTMSSEANRFADDVRSRFGSLRHTARQNLIRDAVRYSSAYRDVPAAVKAEFGGGSRSDVPIVMAGHQPTLFHPGVWFKNFALDRIARDSNSVAVNLVVDNDVASGVAVRVPQRDLATDAVRMTSVAYDRFGGGIPYEQSAIVDRQYFKSFGHRLERELIGLVDQPSIGALWPHAVAAVNRCEIASCAIAQARHALEGQLGLETVELPIGVASRDVSFARFVIELLADLSRFVSIYNDQTVRYRVAHGIRSHAHPVPNLSAETPWLECPLWVYGDDHPNRRGMWAKRVGDVVTLSDREDCHLELDLRDRDAAAEHWASALSSNMKIRPRALLTTMYARWILSDTFLHGIGGGKYDQLGDAIAAEFFGIDPPPFYVCSATVWLPGTAAEDFPGSRQALRRRLRDLRYQPETIAAEWSSSDTAKIERKSELIADIPPRGSRGQWQHEIDAINRDLCDSLAAQRVETVAALDALNRRHAQHRIMTSREHPFAIYPLEYLTDSFAKMLSA